jgi:hypothetical protein
MTKQRLVSKIITIINNGIPIDAFYSLSYLIVKLHPEQFSEIYDILKTFKQDALRLVAGNDLLEGYKIHFENLFGLEKEVGDSEMN